MAYQSTWEKYPTKAFPVPTIDLDLDLLLSIVAIQGKSKYEGAMQDFILKHLESEGLHGHLDQKGNITATKGVADFYPTMVAHMDTVHEFKNNYAVAVSEDGNIVYAYYTAEPDSNLSRLSARVQQTGVGGDDRNGIYVALHMLRHLEVMKVAFFVEEETGGGGSRACDISFFANSSIVLQCDRKGHDDWVQTVSGTKVSSNEFIDSIRDLLTHHGYTVTQGGGFTDVGVLKQKGLPVCAANMSCGYYNPHSSTETIHIPALENTLNLCLAVLERVGETPQLHAHTPYVAPSYNRAYTATSGSSNHFYPKDYGWESVHAPDILKTGSAWGFRKTVLDPDSQLLIVLTKDWDGVRKYELEQKENKELQKVEATALLAKELKKEIKKWVDEDGTWFFEKTKKHWEKVLKDEVTSERWIVGYARLMTDIPSEEKAWQDDWAGWDEVGTHGEFTGFTAQEISRYVHEDLRYKADKEKFTTVQNILGTGASDSFSNFLGGAEGAIDTVDATETLICPGCREELQPHGISNGTSYEYYCPGCMDWKEPLAQDSPSQGLALWREQELENLNWQD